MHYLYSMYKNYVHVFKKITLKHQHFIQNTLSRILEKFSLEYNDVYWYFDQNTVPFLFTWNFLKFQAELLFIMFIDNAEYKLFMMKFIKLNCKQKDLGKQSKQPKPPKYIEMKTF